MWQTTLKVPRLWNARGYFHGALTKYIEPDYIRKPNPNRPKPWQQLAEAISTLLTQTEHWNNCIHDMLESTSKTLTHNLASRIIQNIHQDKDLCLRFFRWLPSYEGFTHNEETYSALIQALTLESSAHYSFVANGILRQKILMGLEVFTEDFDGVITGFMNNKEQYPYALSCLGKMRYMGFSLPYSLTNRMIQDFYDSNMMEYALWVFKGSEYKCLDTESFNLAMKVCCKQGIWDSIDVLFAKMMVTGLEGDKLSFNMLIERQWRCGNVGSVCKIFGVMLKQQCRPDSFTIGSVINALVKLSKPKQACQLFFDIDEAGWFDGALDYSSLTQGLCEQGSLNAAAFFFCTTIKKRYKPPQWLYDLVVERLCGAKMFRDAWFVRDLVIKAQVLDGVEGYNGILRGLCLAGKMKMAYRVFNDMFYDDWVANHRTYRILVGGFCVADDVSGVRKVFDEMKEKGLQLDCEELDLLIKDICSHGNANKALALRNILSDFNWKLDTVTEDFLVSEFCRMGDLDKALGLFRDMLNERSDLCSASYNVLIERYCNKGKSKHALNVLIEILQKGIYPDVSTYNILMKGFLMEGNVSQGLKLKDRMVQNGCDLDFTTYSLLIKGLCKERNIHEAEELLKDLVDKGLVPKRSIITIFVAIYCKRKNRELAIQTLQTLL